MYIYHYYIDIKVKPTDCGATFAICYICKLFTSLYQTAVLSKLPGSADISAVRYVHKSECP